MKVDNVSKWNRSLQNNVRTIAYNAGGRGDIAQYHVDASMMYFFNDGRKNPSVAKIIAHDELKKQNLISKFRFYKKYNSKEFAPERQMFDNTFAELYPKTGDMRNKLISKGRIALHKIKSKASDLEKIFLNIKKL